MASPNVLQPPTLLVARATQHGQLSGARSVRQSRIGSCIKIRVVFRLLLFPLCMDTERAGAPSKSDVWIRRGKGRRDTSCTNSAHPALHSATGCTALSGHGQKPLQF